MQKTELRALKSTLDELDDDDVTAIGRVIMGASPARVQKNIGITIGTFAAMALCAVSPVGGLAMLAGIAGLVVVGGHKDIRTDLLELGLAPALVEDLIAHATLWTTTRAELRNPFKLQLAWKDTERQREIGKNVIAAARKYHGD